MADLSPEDEREDAAVALLSNDVHIQANVLKKGQTNLPDRKRSTMAHAVWHNDAPACEITQLKGNFFKHTGFCVDGRNMLYPEEAVYLAEKLLLAVYDEKDRCLSFEDLFARLVAHIPFEAYLTYLKLKVLRHEQQWNFIFEMYYQLCMVIYSFVIIEPVWCNLAAGYDNYLI